MRVVKIAVGRVFNWDRYENLRLVFELEVDGDENKAIINAFDELLNINNVLLEWNKVEEAYKDAVDSVSKRYGYVFTDWKNDVLRSIGEKKRSLDCLKKSLSLPEACSEAQSVPIGQIERRIKDLEAEIKRLEEKINLIDEAESRLGELKEHFYSKKKEFRDAFIGRDYEQCYAIAKDVMGEIKDFLSLVEKARPSRW